MRVYIAGKEIAEPLLSWARATGFEFAKSGLSNGVVVLVGPPGVHIDGHRSEWVSGFGFDRIFESCFLSMDLSTSARLEAVRELFSSIGPSEYVKSIEATHNAACYDELFGVAGRLCQGEITKLLDLGCGPGTILDSSVSRSGAEIIGFDLVPENLTAANKRGLSVIDEAGFLQLSGKQFNTVLGAYVMHYESMSSEFVQFICGLLLHGGVWVSNFHKGKGLERFRSQIGAIANVRIEECDSRFGPMAAIVRSY